MIYNSKGFMGSRSTITTFYADDKNTVVRSANAMKKSLKYPLVSIMTIKPVKSGGFFARIATGMSWEDIETLNFLARRVGI